MSPTRSHAQKQTSCVGPFTHSSEKAEPTWHILCCLRMIFGDVGTRSQDGTQEDGHVFSPDLGRDCMGVFTL